MIIFKLILGSYDHFLMQIVERDTRNIGVLKSMLEWSKLLTWANHIIRSFQKHANSAQVNGN